MLCVIKYIILVLESIVVQDLLIVLYAKLIILCKPLLNVSYIENKYQNDII
jgi:hypothetical protein